MKPAYILRDYVSWPVNVLLPVFVLSNPSAQEEIPESFITIEGFFGIPRQDKPPEPDSCICRMCESFRLFLDGDDDDPHEDFVE